MERIFKNNSSRCLFIGNRKLENVISQDSKELNEIGGSFEEIADRMQEFINFIDLQYANKKFVPEEEFSKIIFPIINYYRLSHGENWYKNPDVRDEYGKIWASYMANFPQTHFDDEISVLDSVATRGFQECPFEGCNFIWNGDVKILNRKNLKQLTINEGTIHLAKKHHLLEKDNEYGISAKDFYRYFMPKNPSIKSK